MTSGAAPEPATRGELATLWVDEPGAAFNVALVCRFESGPFAGPHGDADLERIRLEVVRRAAAVPALRRRLGSGPHPVWTEETSPAEEHVRRSVLLAGVDLLDWCADRIVVPLDPGRPLWRADVVGLPDGGFALLLVAHHVLADGRTGVAILRSLLDPQPEGPAAHAAPPRPSAPRRRGRWHRVRDSVADLRGRAPVTSLNRPVGPRRRIAVVGADLESVRRRGEDVGATVNDVLLAAVTAGLRELLLARGDAVAGLTLRASVPVSGGSAGQPEGMLLVPLPVGDADPASRLRVIAATTGALKNRLRSGGGNAFGVLRLPTPLAHAAVRCMRHIAARRINLFVTDVPGPAAPLSLAGARLLAAVPVAPLAAGVPLGIAALSYAGRLFVTANADAAVTEPHVLRDAMERELARLPAAVGESGHHGGDRREEPG